MKYLFLAEKNSVMRAVSDAYRKNKEKIDRHLGGEVIFTALSGHVCRWLEPKEYPDWKDKKWEELELPLTPEPFMIAGSNETYAAGVLKNVKQMIRDENPDAYIVGTDSDVEGNGIFYLLSRYLKIEDKPTYRFFEQSLTEREVVDSLMHMTDFYMEPRDIHMTSAFIARSQFDWLVGMNATIAVSLKSNWNCRVGRVKAPTMKLVYDNSEAIDNFKPHSDFQIKALYQDGFSGLMLADEKEEACFETEDRAKAFIAELHETKNAVVKSVERKHVKTGAPVLYKLSALQGEAGTKYSLSPKQTLDTVQSLYEKQLLTYPRTDGTCVSSSKAETFSDLLTAISHVDELAGYARTVSTADIERVKKNKKVVNDEEVKKSSHDALLPTEKAPDMSKLTDTEKHIYLLVAKRFLAQFMPDKDDEKSVLLAEIAGRIFKSNGSVTANPGWSILYEKKESSEKIPEGIKNGDVLRISDIVPHEKVSKPPKRLTSASLVTAMENISRVIDDKHLKDVMKEAKGIGTQATRADIIEQLIKAEYIRCEGKNNSLYIAEKGKWYVETLKPFSIIDASAAAEWESMFQNVKEGIETLEDAQEKTLDYIYDFMEEIATAKIIVHERKDEILPVPCPYCGGKIRLVKWGYACEHSRDNSCNFKVSHFNGKVKPDDIKSLIQSGVTRKIRAISKAKKTGNPFDAKLKLVPKGAGTSSVEFAFDQPKDLGLLCPYCGGKIISYDWGYACEHSGKTGTCNFAISNSKNKVTPDDIKDLLTTGRTRLIQKVVLSRATRTAFAAMLVLEPKGSDRVVRYDNGLPPAPKVSEDLKCPYCGEKITSTQWSFECANKKEGKCSFSVPMQNGLFTESDLRDLLRTGRTRVISGLKSKTKKTTFSAAIILNPKTEKYATRYEFENR